MIIRFTPNTLNGALFYEITNSYSLEWITVELRLSELIKTRGGSDKWIVRIIEQHAILW